MKHYKDPNTSALYAYEEDGSQDDIIPAHLVSITSAEADAIRAALVPQPTVQDQIVAIEATITQRRLREALLGTDAGWLANVDAQIAALRAQL